jgi:radical SAM protein with 4Fe4S-binding SPASM domain
VHIPRVVFETTSACNLDCRYCYNIWKRPGEVPEKPAGYRHALRTLKVLFRQAEVDHITLSGGEPFLAERFLELALACRMRGKSVTVITNGTCGDSADYRSLKEIGVGLVELPVLSHSDEAHDHLTQVRGSWAKTLRSIAILQELKIPVVVVVVLTKVNICDLEDTLDFLAARGISRVMLNRFNVGGRGIEDWQALSPSIGELRSAFRRADAKQRELQISITGNVCTPFCVLDPNDYPHIGMVSCSARPDERPVTLDANGNVRLCNHSPTVLGNIHTAPISDIFRNPYISHFAETVPQPCVGCSEFPQCQGGCRAAGQQLWGCLELGDPLCRLLIPSAKRQVGL